jgi:ligand-binding sensor domain-containing protein
MITKNTDFGLKFPNASLSITKGLRPWFWKGILLFSFLIQTLHAFSQDYNFRNFNSADGLADSYVYSINQDSSGYLWAGTGNGLSRYSGFVFENYTTKDSLSGNFISCSISDGEYMWFGHTNGRVSFFDGGKLHSVNMPQPDLSPITHFAKNPDGQIWVSTYSDGLLKLDKKQV